MKDLSTQSPFLRAALEYARRGWRVFPVGAGTKGRDAEGRSTHLLPQGHKDASADPDRIREWWNRWPDANIGLNLAASGLVAVDPDLYKPDCEWPTFIQGREVPATLVQSSPRGGKHFIFLAEPDASYRGQLCAGVEIKHQGYIMLEPSTFEGSAYRFDTDDMPAPAPNWLPRRNQRPSTDRIGSFGANRTDNGHNLESGQAATVDEVDELLSWIDPDAGGYSAWVEVLQALHDNFGGSATGLTIADNWSAKGAKYTPGDVARRWQGFTPGGGVTLKTIAYRARQNGADLSAIAKRRSNPSHPMVRPHAVKEDQPDLSHDYLALDLGRRSWDADARHVALWGKWLFWKGTHWQRDETLNHLSQVRGYLRTRASELNDWAKREVAALVEQGDKSEARKTGKRIREQAKTLRSHATVVAIANLARANSASAVTHESFDADRFLVGSPHGTVDLRTGELRAARREDMISRQLSCGPAEPGAKPRLWLQFLMEIFESDKATIAFLQRAAGYALTGSTSEHKLLFFHGSGRNGKSVFLNTLLDLWGDYGRRVAATTFLNSQTERHPTDIAGLQGARLAIASELPRGKTWDEAMIKDLTGGDRMTARFMRQDFFEFDPQMTLMIAGNTQPSFRGVDEAIRSRVVLVPFTVTIPQERRDRNLPEKLRAEGPEILRWCINGALAWQERGLDVPASIAAASAAYFDEEDTLGQFLEDETIADPHAIALTEDILLRFNSWCERQGLTSWAKRTLIKELKTRGYSDAKSNGRRGLRGLRLR